MAINKPRRPTTPGFERWLSRQRIQRKRIHGDESFRCPCADTAAAKVPARRSRWSARALCPARLLASS
jgi:hypothetical protein